MCEKCVNKLSVSVLMLIVLDFFLQEIHCKRHAEIWAFSFLIAHLMK
jgi:hypothetical protein